ncbi:SPOR domain-containing protein [Sphingobium boeckii]|uniref:SPOR domain-containing protein n=1 Tax=Sphingobium boeckii TaxID=1082345 RepID=A0A7W9AI13_9SPHN|nr:SPOR domain-containing protein [Sphingobium boeckii]MBB5686065.1 hypothetical protein [Sphingobium boeckii]
MTDVDRDGLNLRDEDRLPWLEAVEDEDPESGINSGKLIGGLIIALILLGLVVGGAYWLKNRGSSTEGDGAVIAAPAGDYKVKPDDAGGMKVEGQGDAAFATSDGAEGGAQIDTNALPEAPVAVTKPAPVVAKPVTPPAAAVSTKVADAGKLAAPVATRPVAAPVASGARGSQVQFGAFGTEAKANQVWANLTKRFNYLAPFSKIVVPVPGASGTVYRLRTDAGSGAAASALCGKLKAAGETCLVQ